MTEKKTTRGIVKKTTTGPKTSAGVSIVSSKLRGRLANTKLKKTGTKRKPSEHWYEQSGPLY